mmetsp:Transcript_2882/g.4109  ORF Transcript_2882/g.4109 Transcript_2882/m.4109 type:complete len:471 (-) Transcript_2882:476-1888(-)
MALVCCHRAKACLVAAFVALLFNFSCPILAFTPSHHYNDPNGKLSIKTNAFQKTQKNILHTNHNNQVQNFFKSPVLAPQARKSVQLNAVSADTLIKSFANIEALLVLCGVITFHELGHFLAARSQGVKIDNFSIGFGPEIYWIKPKNGVRYSLRAIPLGGFVSFPRRIEEEDIEEVKSREPDAVIYDPEDPHLLENRPPLQRVIVISAGVIANLILSFALTFGSATTIGVSKPHFEQGVTIAQILDKSGPAVAAGLNENDKVLAINGQPLPAAETAIQQAVSAIRGSEGETLRFTVQRGDSILDKSVTARPGGAGNNYGIGVLLSSNIDRIDQVKYTNPVEAAAFSSEEVAAQCATILNNFKRLITTGNTGDLSGPLGVVETGAQMAKQDAAKLIAFASAISVNLAVVNALPIPALDGGQFAFVMLEVLSRRKLNKQFVENVNIAFFFVLIGISASSLVGDVQRLSGLGK